jgi:hypothetical protein
MRGEGMAALMDSMWFEVRFRKPRAWRWKAIRYLVLEKYYDEIFQGADPVEAVTNHWAGLLPAGTRIEVTDIT